MGSDGGGTIGTSTCAPVDDFVFFVGDKADKNLPSAIATACEKQLIL
jgi:hypothetical protein